MININKSNFVIAFYIATTSVPNTIKKFHIQSDFDSGYIYNFHNDKQDIIDELFCKCIKSLLNSIDHPSLIQ